jgi:hypothetical protein
VISEAKTFETGLRENKGVDQPKVRAAMQSLRAAPQTAGAQRGALR